MPLIKTKVDRSSDDFAANLAVNAALARDLAELSATVMLGGSERSRERHVKRGKLLPRDRVRMLLDDGSPFLEIGQLAAWQVYDDDVPAAGITWSVTGPDAAAVNTFEDRSRVATTTSPEASPRPVSTITCAPLST